MKHKTKIIEFYGSTCVHCQVMKPVVEEFENKYDVVVEKLEVWENDQNALVFEKWIPLIEKETGGFAVVPTFINPTTKKILTGSQSVEQLAELL